jgi:N-methylhydantoinase A
VTRPSTHGAAVAVDIGGTFTDLVAYENATGALRVSKVLTEVADRARGVAHVIDAGAVTAEMLSGEFIHGTTAATNAVIEGTTARTALITTQGFRDALELMRGDRPLPVYDVNWRKPDPLIPRHLRFEVRERLAADGTVVRALDEAQLRELLRSDQFDEVEAVAVCFLHSFLDGRHERRAAEIIAEERPGLAVSVSCEVDPEVREYERTSTVTLDAMLKPMMSTYLRRLEQTLDAVHAEVLVMLANAGVLSIRAAVERPLLTLHSGPAGGVVGAATLGRVLGRSNLITADMGGTSFDVCAIVDGEPRFRHEGQVRWGIPFRMGLVDVGTIGAGGGTIGWIDDGGLLRVGPHSAGADPGPACYGRGGVEPTVTDAFAVLGYLGTGHLAGGEVELHPELARQAVTSLSDRIGRSPEYVADGMLQIAIAHMAGEIRKNSVERGYDPRMFSLFSFGGAGAMVASRLARMLSMREVIVPPFAGVFSALGMLGAELRCQVRRTLYGRIEQLDPAAVEAAFRDAEAAVLREFPNPRDDVQLRRELSLRYVGQRHELQVPLAGGRASREVFQAARDGFDRLHRSTFEHDRPDEPVELRGLAVTATVTRPVPVLRHHGTGSVDSSLRERRRVLVTGEAEPTEVPVYERNQIAAGLTIEGPAILESPDATVVALGGQSAYVHETGSLLITERPA